MAYNFESENVWSTFKHALVSDMDNKADNTSVVTVQENVDRNIINIKYDINNWSSTDYCIGTIPNWNKDKYIALVISGAASEDYDLYNNVSVVPFDTWYNFSTSIGSMQTNIKIESDTGKIYLYSPSYVGYGNDYFPQNYPKILLLSVQSVELQ